MSRNTSAVRRRSTTAPVGIALALVVVAGACTSERVPDDLVAYPDLILHDAKILTMDRDDDRATVAEAIAIRDGRIVSVGTNADVLRLAGPRTTKEALGGRTVIPGIVDTHTHLMDYAIDRKERDLGLDEALRPTGATWAELKAKTLAGLRDAPARARAGAWLRVTWPSTAAGADGKAQDVKVAIVGGLITRSEIDAVAPSNPVMITGSTRRVFNSRALDVMKRLYGGYDVEMDPATGISVSVIMPRALLSDAMTDLDRLTKAYRDEMVRWAGYGVTTWSSSVSGLTVLPAIASLDRRGDLPTRFAYTQAQGVVGTSTEAAQQFYQHLADARGLGSDRLWDIGVSIVNLDGSYPQMKTSIKAPAAIKAREISFSAPGESRRRILDSQLLAGQRIAGLHIAGDGSLDDYLDAIEAQSALRGMNADQIRAMRHASDHCAVNPRPDQMARLRSLGVIMSCAPKYIADGTLIAAAREYGEQYTRWSVPVKSLLAAGVRTVYESDVDDLDRAGALSKLELLVTREDRFGKVWGPEERVDRMTALRMATRWAAEYVLREKVLGSLEPGKWADLVVLDRDYASVADKELSQIKVVRTLVAGKTVYEQR